MYLLHWHSTLHGILFSKLNLSYLRKNCRVLARFARYEQHSGAWILPLQRNCSMLEHASIFCRVSVAAFFRWNRLFAQYLHRFEHKISGLHCICYMMQHEIYYSMRVGFATCWNKWDLQHVETNLFRLQCFLAFSRLTLWLLLHYICSVAAGTWKVTVLWDAPNVVLWHQVRQILLSVLVLYIFDRISICLVFATSSLTK